MRVAFLIPVSSHTILIDAYPHFRPLEFLYQQQILAGHHSLPAMVTKPVLEAADHLSFCLDWGCANSPTLITEYGSTKGSPHWFLQFIVITQATLNSQGHCCGSIAIQSLGTDSEAWDHWEQLTPPTVSTETLGSPEHKVWKALIKINAGESLKVTISSFLKQWSWIWDL